jgi:hypothetical protein
MPTDVNQPWMMQRVKWESYTLDCISSNSLENIGIGDIHTWKEIRYLSSNNEEIVPKELQISEDSIALSIGGICRTTGYVKSIVRQYCSKEGVLLSVACLQGLLKTEIN